MNKVNSALIIMASLLSMQAQTPEANANDLRIAPSPAKEASAQGNNSVGDACDYFLSRGSSGRFVWSLRELKWVANPNSPLFSFTVGRMVSGPLVLKTGVAQNYTLASNSLFKGPVKYLWKIESGRVEPILVGEIYLEDEVEIEWAIRTSPGVRIVERPILPSKLRYWEPLIAPFKIELNCNTFQRVDFYANAFRDGRLSGTAWIHLDINRGDYSEADEEREKTEIQHESQESKTTANQHADWHQAPLEGWKIQRMEKEFEARHSLTKRYLKEGLRAGEFLTETSDPHRR